MQKFIKGAAIAALASLGLVAAAQAGSYAHDSKVYLTVPSQKGGFVVGFTAWYAEPTNKDTDYALVQDIVTDYPHATTKDVDTKHHFGWKLRLGYEIANTGNDVMIDWTHLRADDSSSVDRDTTSGLLYTLRNNHDILHGGGNPVTGQADHAKGKVDFEFDRADLTFGQHVMVGNHLDMRFYGGASYINVEKDFEAVYQGGDFVALGADHEGNRVRNETSFNGVGIVMGSEAMYHVMNSGFGVHGDVNVALYVGSQGYHDSEKGAGADSVANVVANGANGEFWWEIDGPNREVVVPAIDTKLGVNYTFNFNNGSEVVVEGGYEISKYVNVFDRMKTEATSNLGRTVQTALATHAIWSDFGVNGPYLQVQATI